MTDWCEKARSYAPECVFFEPDDRGNPMGGWFTVALAIPDGRFGPWQFGFGNSIRDAAIWFCHSFGDEDAITAL